MIIITGPSYEALTSEGIQLNVAAGDVEEVTCTVIGDVAYNQIQSGATSRPDTITGLRAHTRHIPAALSALQTHFNMTDKAGF